MPHTHDEYNIIICLDGTFECFVRGGRETLRPGEVMVLNPGEVHHSNYPEGASAAGLTLHVPENAMKRILHSMRVPMELESSSITFNGKARDSELLTFTHELVSELDSRQNGFELVAQALVIQLIVHLLRRCLTPTVQTRGPAIPRQLPSWQMVRALEYMNVCGKNNFKVTDLCSNAGTSVTRFIELFKNSVTTRMTPHAFYNHLLITKAKQHLTDPACSVKEVSFELGFQNESHFCKVFRSCSGTTPGSYRLSLR